MFAGDIIYADNPIPPTKEIPPEVGGGVWVNDPTKDFVAITIPRRPRAPEWTSTPSGSS